LSDIGRHSCFTVSSCPDQHCITICFSIYWVFINIFARKLLHGVIINADLIFQIYILSKRIKFNVFQNTWLHVRCGLVRNKQLALNKFTGKGKNE